MGIYCGSDDNLPPKLIATVERSSRSFREADTDKLMFAMSKKMAAVLCEIADIDLGGLPEGVAAVLRKANRLMVDMHDYVVTRDQDDSLAP